jgi:hypothetical protein
VPLASSGAPIAPRAASVATRTRSPREAEDAELVDLREATRTDGADISRAQSAIWFYLPIRMGAAAIAPAT